MFQTEPIRWLQSFSTEGLTWLMWAISTIGQPYIYLGLLLVTILAVDYRKGIILTNGLLFTYLVVVLLKTSFALPRPYQVDAAVMLLGSSQPNPSPFLGYGASSFFGGLPADVIAHYRSFANPSFGFPSGHCASAVMVWGMLALLFHRRALVAAAWILIPLMPVSRMYLGVHFLFDVLGGTLIGLGLFGIASLMLKMDVSKRFLHPSPDGVQSADLPMRAAAVASIVLPLLFLLLSATRTQAGTLLGLNGAVLLTLPWTASLRHSNGRIVAGILCLVVIVGMFAYGRTQSWNPFSEAGTLADGMLNAVFAFVLIALPVAGSRLAVGNRPNKSEGSAHA